MELSVSWWKLRSILKNAQDAEHALTLAPLRFLKFKMKNRLLYTSTNALFAEPVKCNVPKAPLKSSSNPSIFQFNHATNENVLRFPHSYFIS